MAGGWLGCWAAPCARPAAGRASSAIAAKAVVHRAVERVISFSLKPELLLGSNVMSIRAADPNRAREVPRTALAENTPKTRRSVAQSRQK